MSNREQQSSQNDQNLLRPETSYDYEASVNGQTLGSDFLNVIPSSTNEKDQVFYKILLFAGSYLIMN